MASPQHTAWIRRGRPWRLARPLLRLRDRLRGYGYTVYDLGNEEHLDHQPPERHCPYSETNWPAYIGRPMPDVVTAIDIMPPKPGLGLPSLQQLGAQLFADRQAGVAGVSWLVGMNWGPTSDRTAVRDTWRPGRVRSSSGDAGHIHAECRSDALDSTVGDDYDPVARLRGQQGVDMPLTQADKDEIVYRTATIVLAGVQPAGWADQTAPEPYRGQLRGAATNARLVELLTALGAGLKAIAARVDVDPAELAAIEEAARRGAASVAVDVQALAAALADALDVDQAVVVAALESPAGQAAIVAAANAAEDS